MQTKGQHYNILVSIPQGVVYRCRNSGTLYWASWPLVYCQKSGLSQLGFLSSLSIVLETHICKCEALFSRQAFTLAIYTQSQKHNHKSLQTNKIYCNLRSVLLVEFIYFVFPRMLDENYCRWLRVFAVITVRDIFRALISSLVCWFYSNYTWWLLCLELKHSLL